jgi:S1-C subfamily serine protease
MTRIQRSDPSRRQVLSITRLVGGSNAAQLLQPGDLLLAVDGQIVTGFRDVERAVAARATVQVTIWRTDGEHLFSVQTAALSGNDIDRVVLWEGATLQASHRAISAQRGIEPSGVYVAYFSYGSPASRSGLIPGRRIVEVDGQPTPDLDSFLKLATGRADRTSLRIKTLAINGAPEMITLKLDRHYWPAYELRRRGDLWERAPLE